MKFLGFCIAVGELAVMLDDERNENKTLKRKNVANIKVTGAS